MIVQGLQEIRHQCGRSRTTQRPRKSEDARHQLYFSSIDISYFVDWSKDANASTSHLESFPLYAWPCEAFSSLFHDFFHVHTPAISRSSNVRKLWEYGVQSTKALEFQINQITFQHKWKFWTPHKEHHFHWQILYALQIFQCKAEVCFRSNKDMARFLFDKPRQNQCIRLRMRILIKPRPHCSDNAVHVMTFSFSERIFPISIWYSFSLPGLSLFRMLRDMTWTATEEWVIFGENQVSRLTHQQDQGIYQL